MQVEGQMDRKCLSVVHSFYALRTNNAQSTGIVVKLISDHRKGNRGIRKLTFLISYEVQNEE
jgi:hypothetical protein